MNTQDTLMIARNHTNEHLATPNLIIPDMNRVKVLGENERESAIEFLAARPVHTVVMNSFIRDNGITGDANRGKYYAYSGIDGEIEGIALIGHSTLIEARSDEALVAFAILAKQSETPIHVMMADGRTIERFWKYYAEAGQEPRLTCTELLFEVAYPHLVKECDWQLRTAKPEELQPIAVAHAEVAFIESGVNPMERDPDGFFERTLKRIERGRTFVVFGEDGELIFKADIVAETDDVVYLEGIYVSPDRRGQGIGPECLAELSRRLMDRAEHICLLSNVDFKGAHRSFEKAGYVNSDQCITIFV